MMRWLIGLGALLVATCAAAQPVLRYEAPANFYRSSLTPPEDYSAKEFNAGLQVYPFRPFRGSIEETFRRTLLRDWIEPRFQEANVVAQPDFRSVDVPGAHSAFSVRFAERVGTGVPRQHMRMVVVVGNTAAIVDASASSMEVWQRALPAFNTVAATLNVK